MKYSFCQRLWPNGRIGSIEYLQSVRLCFPKLSSIIHVCTSESILSSFFCTIHLINQEFLGSAFSINPASDKFSYILISRLDFWNTFQIYTCNYALDAIRSILNVAFFFLLIKPLSRKTKAIASSSDWGKLDETRILARVWVPGCLLHYGKVHRNIDRHKTEGACC